MTLNSSMWPRGTIGSRHDMYSSKPRLYLSAQSVSGANFYTFPVYNADNIVRENADFMERLTENSYVDSVWVWLGAISRGYIPGNHAAAKRAGAIGQPDWDYRNKKNRDLLGISEDQGESLGNFNFGVTGYVLGMKLMEKFNIPEAMAEPLVQYTVRGGGGGFQVFGDLIKLYDLGMDAEWTPHTWYGEEVKDVPDVQAGMDYGRFIRLAKISEKYGVKLDPQPFGFDLNEKSTYSILLGKEIQFVSEAKEFHLKIEGQMIQLRREREEYQRKKDKELEDIQRQEFEKAGQKDDLLDP